MEKVRNIDDLYALKFEANRDGLDLKQYFHKLRVHGISYETAVENIRSGVSIEDHLASNVRSEKRKNRRINALIGLGTPALALGSMIIVTLTSPIYSSETQSDQGYSNFTGCLMSNALSGANSDCNQYLEKPSTFKEQGIIK